MNLKSFGIALALCSSLVEQSAFAKTEIISYTSARGSVLTLDFAENNLSGTFTTAVASKDCQEAIGMERPIVGFIADNAITFSVTYPGCGSVVTFIGNIENNKKTIDTTTIVAHQSANSLKDRPGARMLSHDVFTQNESL